ncbi:MAG: hypothetical protein AAGA96_15300 [Verrucomicrobiota bacterium]
MSVSALIIFAIVAVVFPVAMYFSTRSPIASIIAKIIASLIALGFAFFCAFGFLASFEPSSSPSWPWQVLYAVLGIGSLSIPVVLFAKRRRRDQRSS